jgi:hypothetical protein
MSVVRMDIHVDNPVDTAVVYDLIQVWRSPDEDGDPTPFVQITAPAATQAVLNGNEEGPWNLNGLTLTVTVDGGPSIGIGFSGTNPLALSQVLEIINEEIPGFATENGENTNLLRLTSPTYGTRSSIAVTASMAATLLGLSVSRANGKAASPLLAQTTEEYTFVDYDGDAAFWYRTRYYNSATGSASAFSPSRRGSVPDVLPASSLLLCHIYLADGAGLPIANRRVVLVPTRQVQITNDSDQVYGILSSVDRIVMTTNDSGYAEQNLVRGQTFKVFIEGTPFQREVTIPATGSSLNLLTAASTADDPFTIVDSPPMPIRVS